MSEDEQIAEYEALQDWLCSRCPDEARKRADKREAWPIMDTLRQARIDGKLPHLRQIDIAGMSLEQLKQTAATL